MTQVTIVLRCPPPQDKEEAAVTQKSSPHYVHSAARWRTSPPATISLSSMGLPSKGISYQTEQFDYFRTKKIMVMVIYLFSLPIYVSFYSFLPLFHPHRSLSELEGIRVAGDMGEKFRQVTERATLFRITSNAMINVSHPSVNC